MTPRARAEDAQRTASNPVVSAFVAASAGSGKTKLLTDRLLRLMLAGAVPARIQCLTFTKAAAAEMALRLHATLGRWVTASDAELDTYLAALECAPSETVRTQARALFARVLDLPGGMRIGTIHAFCQSLLRRFPLEASISPHFQLADDLDSAIGLRASREAMLADDETPESMLALLAEHATLDQFATLNAELQGEAPAVHAAAALGSGLLPALRRALGLDAHSDADLLAHAAEWPGEPVLHGAAEIAFRTASPAIARKAEAMLAWLAEARDTRPDRWDDWCAMFLCADGTARKPGAFVNKKLADQHPELAGIFVAEAGRITAVEDQRRALRVADASAALIQFAAPVLASYAARKDGAGLLDFDDLIGRTARLLQQPGAAWVLYKLDGGLDHLLLDEVQDTAPEQWDIAHALTAEFFAGAGARDTVRTVFAVGDRKQSIFSFQGADAAAFYVSRDRMAERVRASGHQWRDVPMDVSFRSTAPVLALVDAVFALPEAAVGVTDAPLSHLADRVGAAGRLELWPLAPRIAAEPVPPWAVPDRNEGMSSAPQRLAETLAAWIAGQTGGSVMLESRDRPLGPGDVLVLLRRRSAFDRSLVRALKQLGVPVAGLDRLVLAEQPAVADLLALCAVLLNRDDDLSLACVLKSPLGFCDEDSLYALAIDRPGTLWSALHDRAPERADWTQARAFIEALMARVDHATPHALLSEALAGLGGRARLFARLGNEAAEPIDELLNQALAFQRAHPPSLQGFCDWLARSAREVKREAEGAGGSVRIMTVHGAKGLQAPLVILPDTAQAPTQRDTLYWARDPQTGTRLPLWSPRKELRCAAVDRLREAERVRDTAEYNRLLYVALTRAEDRLLVCGWEAKTVTDGCWYQLVARGFAALEPTASPFDAWDGEALSVACPQTAEPRRGRAADHRTGEPLPAWAGSAPDWTPTPLPAETPLPLHLAPSRPEGIRMGPVPSAASPLSADAGGARFQRGRLVHTLLQHLPDLPPADRASAARAWLARSAHAAIADGLAEEVLAVLGHPALAPLFGPGSRAEAPLTGVLGDTVIGGLVDRLAVLPGRVLIADFKTNREPPATAAATPVLYLRQLAAYRALLRRIYPGRPITCALVWTRGARVDVLPDGLLDPHDPGMAATAA